MLLVSRSSSGIAPRGSGARHEEMRYVDVHAPDLRNKRIDGEQRSLGRRLGCHRRRYRHGWVARPLRFINVLFGLWLIAAPCILDGASGVAAAGSIAAGIGLTLLSLPMGSIKNRYAGWNRFIF